ncbi:MAG: S1C family serine protease [Acidimicrobiales bacterium]
MSEFGQDPFGDGPDEADNSDFEYLERPGEMPSSPGEPPLQGWLPPEQRVWRHPSEFVFANSSDRYRSSRGGPARNPGSASRPHLGERHRTSLRGAVLLGGGVALAMVAGLVLLNSGGSSTRAPSSSLGYPINTTASLNTGIAAIPRRVSNVVRSMVLLKDTTSSGTTYAGCGIAIGPHGLVLTSAQSIKGATSLIASGSNLAPTAATVVGVDPGSDIALVRVPGATMPTASLAGDRSTAPGSGETVLSLAGEPTSNSDPGGVLARSSPATFDYIGSPPQDGSGSSLADIMVTTSNSPQPPGAVLVNSAGGVIGLLDQSVSSTLGPRESPRSPNTAFLPSDLLAGVTNYLVHNRPLKHGWLGIDGRDATVPSTVTGGPTGALVATVDPNGPAANSLKAGDVIEAVSGHPVRSMAELRARLYVMPPGTPVQLKVVRDGTPLNVEVDLASSP